MMNIFDARRMSENIKRIKEQLGSSSQGQEFEQKSHGGMGEVDEAAQDSFEQILVEFGQMYANGNAYTEYLNKMGGTGTAEFMFDEIRIYCGK